MIFRNFLRSDRPLSDPGEARTHDPMIKSHLLYQLSYGVIVGMLARCGVALAESRCFSFASAKLVSFFELCKLFLNFFF